MIFHKRFSDFKNYLLLNKSSALVIFIIYSVVNINIGLAEYPYMMILEDNYKAIQNSLNIIQDI